MNGSPPRLDLAVERARRAVGHGLPARDRLRRARHRRARLRALGDQPGAARLGRAATSVVNTRSRDEPARLGARASRGGSDGRRGSIAHDGRPARPARPGARRGHASSGCRGSSSRRSSGSSPALLLGAIAARRAPGARRRGRRRPRPAPASPIEALILPAVAAVACLGAIRLVPFGLWLVPALAVTWLLVRRDAGPRGADPPRAERADRRRPDGGAGHDPAGRVHRLHRRRGDGAGRPGRAARRRTARCPRRTCWSSRPATGSSPGCSAIAPSPCGSPRLSRRAVVGGDVRGRDRDRRGRAAGDGDPAPDRARPC